MKNRIALAKYRETGDFLRKRFKTGSVSFELLAHLSQRLPEKAVITVTHLSLAEMSFMNFSAYQTLNQGRSSCIVVKIDTAKFVISLKSDRRLCACIFTRSLQGGEYFATGGSRSTRMKGA